MSYCIMRVEKRKRASLYGLQLEANRTAADHEQGRDFAASDIQWELTPFNFFLVKAENWNKAVTAALKEAEIQERKNSVVLLDGFYGASKEWFLNKSMAEIVDYFEDCLAFHEKHYGKVINAVIHFDEATPHLTCQSLPIVQREDGHCSLSARDIMGGRADYRKRQDLFYEQVGKSRGLERGEVHDPEHIRKHLSVQQYKNEQLEFENQQLEAVNQTLLEQTQEPFFHYCMKEFIKNAKTRGEHGEVKHIKDGFHIYMERNYQRLRDSWEQQYGLVPLEEERVHEREYEQTPEYDDRER